ncbi:hypothetical protein DFJ73DRAFT_818917 [Zopfochytrium polystomum]|nr:hypothetical protein DFJ73DRAFT_818917 [Zopfochytrium polystomum]
MSSPFSTELKNGRHEGFGKYVFPDGNVYVGDFKDGQFHGQGTIHFLNGGQYSATWSNGVVVEGKYTFKDGLVYESKNWDYCTLGDRRFFHERVEGFQGSGY